MCEMLDDRHHENCDEKEDPCCRRASIASSNRWLGPPIGRLVQGTRPAPGQPTGSEALTVACDVPIAPVHPTRAQLSP